MNLDKTMSKITSEFAHKVAEYEDSAVYAYLKAEVEALEKKGEDLTQYELIFITTETTIRTEDGFKIQKAVRLHKYGTPL